MGTKLNLYIKKKKKKNSAYNKYAFLAYSMRIQKKKKKQIIWSEHGFKKFIFELIDLIILTFSFSVFFFSNSFIITEKTVLVVKYLGSPQEIQLGLRMEHEVFWVNSLIFKTSCNLLVHCSRSGPLNVVCPCSQLINMVPVYLNMAYQNQTGLKKMIEQAHY